MCPLLQKSLPYLTIAKSKLLLSMISSTFTSQSVGYTSNSLRRGGKNRTSPLVLGTCWDKTVWFIKTSRSMQSRQNSFTGKKWKSKAIFISCTTAKLMSNSSYGSTNRLKNPTILSGCSLTTPNLVYGNQRATTSNKTNKAQFFLAKSLLIKLTNIWNRTYFWLLQ